MQIDELVFKAHTNALKKGWWDDPENIETFPSKIALIHSEASEALEEYRAGHHPRVVYFVDGKPEGVPIELADIVIRIADLCGYYKIDLTKAIETKMVYNATRSHRHGNKAV